MTLHLLDNAASQRDDNGDVWQLDRNGYWVHVEDPDDTPPPAWLGDPMYCEACLNQGELCAGHMDALARQAKDIADVIDNLAPDDLDLDDLDLDDLEGEA